MSLPGSVVEVVNNCYESDETKIAIPHEPKKDPPVHEVGRGVIIWLAPSDFFTG